jgi:hypothetical protein
MRMHRHGNLIVAVEDSARVPPGNSTQRNRAVRPTFNRSQGAHARGSVQCDAAAGGKRFFGRYREILMKDTIEEQDGIVLGGGTC